MNYLLRKLLSQVCREEESGEGAGGGGSDLAPADSEGAGVDWAELNAEVDPGSDDEEGEGASETPAANSPQSASTKPQTPATQAAATEQTTQTPATETQSQEQQQIEKQKTPEELKAERDAEVAKFNELKQAALANLENNYKFDDETAARLLTEPELVLPKLAAQLQLNAVEQTLAIVQQMIPQIVPQVNQTQQRETAATDAFYTANPDLKDHHKAVLMAGANYRKMNPKATPEQAIKAVGEIVRATLGLPAPTSQPQVQAKQSTPAKGAPHRPAQPGGGTGTKMPAKSGTKTDWDDLIDD